MERYLTDDHKDNYFPNGQVMTYIFYATDAETVAQYLLGLDQAVTELPPHASVFIAETTSDASGHSVSFQFND